MNRTMSIHSSRVRNARFVEVNVFEQCPAHALHYVSFDLILRAVLIYDRAATVLQCDSSHTHSAAAPINLDFSYGGPDRSVAAPNRYAMACAFRFICARIGRVTVFSSSFLCRGKQPLLTTSSL